MYITHKRIIFVLALSAFRFERGKKEQLMRERERGGERERGNRGITISGFSNSALTAKRVAPYTHAQQNMASETGIKINGRRTGQWRTRLMLDVVTAASGSPKRRGDVLLERGCMKREGFLWLREYAVSALVLTAVHHATSIQIAPSRPAPDHHRQVQMCLCV